MDVANESSGSNLKLAFVPNLHRFRALHLARRHPLLVDKGAVSTAQVCEEKFSAGTRHFGVVLAAPNVIQEDVLRDSPVFGAADRASHARDDEERPYFDARLGCGDDLSPRFQALLLSFSR